MQLYARLCNLLHFSVTFSNFVKLLSAFLATVRRNIKRSSISVLRGCTQSSSSLSCGCILKNYLRNEEDSRKALSSMDGSVRVFIASRTGNIVEPYLPRFF